LWRSRFLRALARTANAKLSAAIAGVHHTTAFQLRERDPMFAAAWLRAREWGRDRVKAEGRPVFAGGRPRDAREGEARGAPAPGEALDPRRWTLRRSRRDGAQRVRAGEGRMSDDDIANFLAYLDAGHGIGRSAALAGFSTTAFYNRRQNDPELAERWGSAKAGGIARNEALLIEAVPRALGPAEAGEAEDLPAPSIAEAIRIVALFHAKERGGARRRRWETEAPPIEQVRDEVLKRLAAIRGHRARNGDRPREETEKGGCAAAPPPGFAWSPSPANAGED
jgi:hypothetical protein